MKPNRITIHCSASEFGDVEQIRLWHLKKGWADVGYHWILLNGYKNRKDKYNRYIDGAFQEGRLEDVQGAGVKGENEDNLHICLIGERRFTFKQFSALVDKVLVIMKKYDIKLKDVKGHYQYDPNKECPCFDMEILRCIVKKKLMSAEVILNV